MFLKSLNHPGPSLTTTWRWKPPIQLQSGPRNLDTLLHLHILSQHNDRSLHFGNENVARFPGVLIYDELELNSGAFPVKQNDNLMLAGFTSPIPHDRINIDTLANDLYNDPDFQLATAARNFKFVDLGDMYSSTVYTSFISGTGNHSSIIQNLDEVIECATKCLKCLNEGRSCEYDNVFDACSSCASTGELCQSLSILHVMSDKLASQVSLFLN